MHVVKKIFEFVGKTVKWSFIVFLVYLLSLFFRRERLPGEWIEGLITPALPTNLVVHCDTATFGWRRGLKVENIKLYDLSRKNTLEPLFAAESIEVRPFDRLVRGVGVRVPRLHDGYYEEGGYAEPLGYGDWGVRLPKVPKFRLELFGANILGAAPDFLRAVVTCRPTRLSASEVHIVWNMQERPAEVDGFCDLDLSAKKVRGRVKGEATQAKIRPLIQVLDLPLVVEYMDAFTKVEKPVPVNFGWDVDLGSNEFSLDFDIHPELGRYNNVSMARADGEIGLHVTFPVRDGVRHMDYETTIGPLVAIDVKDRLLKGRLQVRGVGDVAHIHFDASSALRLEDILKIIDYLNEGELDCLVCETPPQIQVSGILATDVAHQRDNDLRGSISFERGSLFGIPLWEASTDFAYVGDTVYFNSARAKGKLNGKVAGSARLMLPELDPDRAMFMLDLTYKDGSVAEVSDFFSFDAGDKHGEVEGELSVSGPISTNAIAHLNGSGRATVRNGHLSQMKLFMGLTELLAREVPGVDKIVNQSEGSCTFSIEEGVFKSYDIKIEGSLFSIYADGQYDMAKDDLDFMVRVQLMKDESLLGKYLIRPIMWPFTKLLLEFRVRGPIDDPDWDYITVLDRIK